MFIADEHYDYPTWRFMKGKPKQDFSIVLQRYYRLLELNNMDELQLSIRDIDTNHWTRWKGVDETPLSHLTNAYDIHRTLLYNEILIESDYPDYEDNVNAIKWIGKILEMKGYNPMYYYSGSKSIHCHIFINIDSIEIPAELTTKIDKYFNTRKEFYIKFIRFMRDKFINCFGTNMFEFDKDLIKAKHLIRSELSLNKKGFKTFLGYMANKLSFKPHICNIDTAEYPELGDIMYSDIKDSKYLVLEFINNIEQKINSKPKPIKKTKYNPEYIRTNVEYLLSDKFIKLNDFRKRALFIICNELKEVYGTEPAMIILTNWNKRLGNYFDENDLKYRVFKQKTYKISNAYINELIKEIKNGN